MLPCNFGQLQAQSFLKSLRESLAARQAIYYHRVQTQSTRC